MSARSLLLLAGALTLAGAACGKKPASVAPDPASTVSTPSAAVSAVASSLNVVVAKEGAYRVTYPAAARLMPDRVMEVATDVGTVALHVSGANAGDAIYAVEWGNYPPYFVVEQGEATTVAKGTRAVLAAEKGTVVAESSFVDHGDHWQEVVYRVDGKIAWHRLRATMRGARMYLVMVSALERAGIDDAREKAFFESFTLMPVAGGPSP